MEDDASNDEDTEGEASEGEASEGAFEDLVVDKEESSRGWKEGIAAEGTGRRADMGPRGGRKERKERKEKERELRKL